MATIDYVRSKGYQNVQDYVNSGYNCTCDETRLDDLVNYMLANEWIEVDKDDIPNYDYSKGDLIKYVTKKNNYTNKGGSRVVKNVEGEETEMQYGSFSNKFRSGGWFIDVRTGDNGDYILYKSHKLSQPPISVQFNNISRMFVLSTDSQKKISNKRPVYYQRPGQKTKFPVKLKDNCGTEVIVYYAKTKYAQDLFMKTKKFERAQKNGWKFK